MPRAEVERFLRFARPDLRDIVFELRDIVWRVCPEATERILWGGLSYHLSQKGGPVKGAVCQIELEKDHVLLSFIHGVRLTDPCSLLTGSRKSKRYLVIDSFEDAPWKEILELVKEAAEFDPTSFGSIPDPSNRNA
jgi:hypothetical protein